MTLPPDKKGKRTTRGQPAAGSTRIGARRAPSPEIGSALRSVYDGALAEDIPPEMLDLLGKLG